MLPTHTVTSQHVEHAVETGDEFQLAPGWSLLEQRSLDLLGGGTRIR